MESQEAKQKPTEQATNETTGHDAPADTGAGLFAGAVIFLAGYGLYKLISHECEKKLALSGHTETNLLERMINEEMK